MKMKMVSSPVLMAPVGFRPMWSMAYVPTREQTRHHAFKIMFYCPQSAYNSNMRWVSYDLQLCRSVRDARICQHLSQVVRCDDVSYTYVSFETREGGGIILPARVLNTATERESDNRFLADGVFTICITLSVSPI